jgi:hypothetical protein
MIDLKILSYKKLREMLEKKEIKCQELVEDIFERIEKEVYLPSLKTELKEEVRNFELGRVNLQLKVSGKVYSKLDPLTIKKAIAGKGLEETKLFLLNQKGISKTKIEIFPFWIKKIPDDINRVEISYPIID